MLTFHPAKHAIPKWFTGRKWHIPMAVMRRNRLRGLGWQYGTKVKSHVTGIDWCTGREWPANCMTVISAWWQSNMPFQRLSGWLNYYITRWGQEVSDLEIRWVRDEMWLGKPPPSRRALGTPDWVWRPDQLVWRCWKENMSQRGWTLRPPGWAA